MKFKTNAVVGIVFLALLAFVYFYEIKGGEERKAEADKAKELLDFTPSDALRLTLDRGDTVIVLEKSQDEWKLVEPVADLADQQAVDRLLNNIDETEREREVADSAAVAEDAQVAAKYGLDAPRLKVRIETDAGELDRLSFGDDTPTERYAYVQLGGANPEIFLVRAFKFDNLNKGIFDLRDRRVLAFETDEVKELHLDWNGENIALVRADEDAWQLRAEVDVPADKDEVDDMLRSLDNAKIQSFVDDEDLAEYVRGEPPLLELSLLVGEDRAEKRVWVGPAEGGDYYARDLSRAPVFLVDSTVVHKLQKSTGDLRNKEPIDFELDDITRIELDGESGALVALKDTADQWQITVPEERRAKSWKLSGLLNDLKGVKVEEFVDDRVEDLAVYRLDDPRLEIRLQAGEQEVLEARLAEADGDQAFFTVVGTPSVYLVKGEMLTDLDLELEDIAHPKKEEPAASTDVAEASADE